MSAPARRSKWDQAPSIPIVPAPQGSGTGPQAAAQHGLGSASEGSNARGIQSDVSSRAEAFLSSALGSGSPAAPSSSSAPSSAPSARGWVPPGHPDYVAPKAVFSGEVNINGCRPEIRYTMTSRETFDMIEEEFSATVITRGTFKQGETTNNALDTSNLAPEDKPLHLYVTADSQDQVDRACARLKTLLERPSTTPSGLLMNKVYIPYAADVDPAFPLPGKIIGPAGSFVKHIQTTTGCKVHLRGKGSSYFEANSRMEAPEALHLFITGPTEQQVQQAKHLSEQLIASVKKKYDQFLLDRRGGGAPGPHQGYQGPHQGHQHGSQGPHAGGNGPHQGPGPNGPPGPHGPPHAQQNQPHNAPNGSEQGLGPHNAGTLSAQHPSSERPRSPYGRSNPPPPPPTQPYNEHQAHQGAPGGPGVAPPSGPSSGPHGGPNRNDGYHQQSYNQHSGGNYNQHQGRQDYRSDNGSGPQGSYPPQYPQSQPSQGNNAPSTAPGAAEANAQQAYAEWTPEAIAAYYAYYGMPVPPQAAQYMQQAAAQGQQASGQQQPPPPPSTASAPATNGASHNTKGAVDDGAMEMEMDMDDDDSEVIVTAKGKRLHADAQSDSMAAKRGKHEEGVGARPPPPPTDQPFWSSTQK